jgi:hypothetical protein
MKGKQVIHHRDTETTESRSTFLCDLRVAVGR